MVDATAGSVEVMVEGSKDCTVMGREKPDGGA